MPRFRDRLQQLLVVPVGTVVTVGAAVLLITIMAFFRVPLLPDIGKDTHMSTVQLGLFTTAFALGRLVTDIPAGRFADRLHITRMMAAAAAAVGGGSLLLGSSVHVVPALAAAFVLGVGSAVANTSGMTFFTSAAPARFRGTLLSAYSAAQLGGQAFGPAVGGLIAAAGGWRGAELVAAAVGVVVTVSLLTLRPRKRTAEPGVEPPRPKATTRVLGLSRPALLALHAIPFAFFGTMGSMNQTLVPVIGSQLLGLTAATIGLAVGVGGIGRLVGALVGGQISDRLSRKRALVPALFVQGTGVAILGFATSTLVWMIAIVVMSLASFSNSVAGTMIADLTRGSGVGRHLGLFRFVGDAGMIVAPTVVAQLFGSYGRLAATLPVAALLFTVGLAAAFVLPETRYLEAAGAPSPG